MTNETTTIQRGDTQCRYLIAIHIGPVQDFIAAARRTRDMWFGSHLISEISKAAAKSLTDGGAVLVFPTLQADDDDNTGLTPESELVISNRILVELNATSQVLTDTVRRCKEAARGHWRLLANNARELGDQKVGKDSVSPIRDNEWDLQIEDVLEIYSAWVPVVDNNEQAAVQRVESLLNARKATRDFTGRQGNPGWDKSSLDGCRETVLDDDRHHKNGGRLSAIERLRLGLGDREQLDCPGLVKRLCPSSKSSTSTAEQFTPIARIAAAPWIKKVCINKDAKTAWDKVLNAHKAIYALKLELTSRVSGNRDDSSKQSIYTDFPYDGEMLYAFRLPRQRNILKSLLADEQACQTLLDGKNEGHPKKALEAITEIGNALKILKKQLKDAGQPCPYVAVLQADGDGMGEAMYDRGLNDRRLLSQALGGFSQTVRKTAQVHFGHCIYAGADDLLILLPVDGALLCADALRAKFIEYLQPVYKSLGLKTAPSLSVGIGISHAFQPLSTQRQVATSALELAKGRDLPVISARKNALGIIVSHRSGSDLSLRSRWQDSPEDNPANRLLNWVGLFKSGALPGSVGYDLLTAARRFKWANKKYTIALKNEVLRILSKKRNSSDNTRLEIKIAPLVVSTLKAYGYDMPALSNELILCRWLNQQGVVGNAIPEEPSSELAAGGQSS